MTTKHATCTHPQTKAGRAACRKGSTPTITAAQPNPADASGVNRGRTDIHRPVSFDPEAYEYSHAGTWHSDEMYHDIRREAARMLRLRLDEGYTMARHQHSGQCGHCGARLTHYAAMLHPASKEIIYVGETCLDNRFEMATHAFQAWRKMRAGANARNAKAAKLAAFLENRPEAQTIISYGGTNDFIRDLQSRLIQYAELSDKQLDAAARAITRDAERQAAQAAREAMKAHLAPLTPGRRAITGKIVSTKWVDSDFGYGGGSLKMLIEDAEGYRYWGTCPSAVEDPAVGVELTITATIQPKEDDPTFAFFKRPSLKG